MNSSTQKENTRTLLSLLGEQLGERLCEPTPIQAETVLGKIHLRLDAISSELLRGEERDGERLLDSVIAIAATSIEFAATSILPEIQREEGGRRFQTISYSGSARDRLDLRGENLVCLARDRNCPDA